MYIRLGEATWHVFDHHGAFVPFGEDKTSLRIYKLPQQSFVSLMFYVAYFSNSESRCNACETSETVGTLSM